MGRPIASGDFKDAAFARQAPSPGLPKPSKPPSISFHFLPFLSVKLDLSKGCAGWRDKKKILSPLFPASALSGVSAGGSDDPEPSWPWPFMKRMSRSGRRWWAGAASAEPDTRFSPSSLGTNIEHRAGQCKRLSRFLKINSGLAPKRPFPFARGAKTLRRLRLPRPPALPRPLARGTLENDWNGEFSGAGMSRRHLTRERGIRRGHGARSERPVRARASGRGAAAAHRLVVE